MTTDIVWLGQEACDNRAGRRHDRQSWLTVTGLALRDRPAGSVSAGR